MKTKGEITQEYVDMINDIENKLESYEDDIKSSRRKIMDQSDGNRRIEDIDDEFDVMIREIGKMKDECRSTKSMIKLNENNF